MQVSEPPRVLLFNCLQKDLVAITDLVSSFPNLLCFGQSHVAPLNKADVNEPWLSGISFITGRVIIENLLTKLWAVMTRGPVITSVG